MTKFRPHEVTVRCNSAEEDALLLHDVLFWRLVFNIENEITSALQPDEPVSRISTERIIGALNKTGIFVNED